MKLRPALLLASSAISAMGTASPALAATHRPSLAFASAQPTESGDGGQAADATSSSAEADDMIDVPQLPAAKPDDPTVPVLKLGESMSFEELGPVIINADGTTRRIDNWDDMTEREREVAWKRISKRNRARREALEAKQAARTEEEPHPPEMDEESTGFEGVVEPSGGGDDL